MSWTREIEGVVERETEAIGQGRRGVSVWRSRVSLATDSEFEAGASSIKAEQLGAVATLRICIKSSGRRHSRLHFRRKVSTWCIFCCDAKHEMLTCNVFPCILFERDQAVSDAGQEGRRESCTSSGFWTTRIFERLEREKSFLLLHFSFRVATDALAPDTTSLASSISAKQNHTWPLRGEGEGEGEAEAEESRKQRCFVVLLFD